MVEIEEPSVEKTLTVEGDTNNPGNESLPPKVDDGEEQTNKEGVGDSQEDKEDAAETEEDDDRDNPEDESEGQTKTMKKKNKKPRKYSITVRCSMNKVSQHFIVGIKEEKERTSFQKSCFGQFLKLQANEFRMLTPIVFEVVKRRVDRCKYRIGGKIMSFTPLDVTLILGLRIGELPSEFVLRKKKDEPSAFRVEYFGKKKSINAKDIEEVIEKAKASNKEADVDRLNRLYLLPICLLPEKARNVDLRYIDLAADLKKFDEFPWGTVVYDCLADSLETVYKYVKEEKINYGIHGCILTFIIWAYQHVLTLGPRRDSTAEFPRMLGWRDLPAKCRKETTISKLWDNKKRKKPEKDYLYYPQKPTIEEKTIEVVQEAIEWMKEIEADAVSESFTSIPSSSSTHGNFDVEGLKNIIGL
ncbi:hypothetical protein FRX31_007206, partial [Thalictrum thalictroides]